jgi:hypothetical protein
LAAGCLHALRRQLECKPWLRMTLLASVVTLQLSLALLLLVSLLQHAQGQLLLCVLGLLGLTMLQRLLMMLSEPKLHRGLTHAASLQGQLQLLLQCVLQPLGVPHNRWTLAFEDGKLEDRYRKVSFGNDRDSVWGQSPPQRVKALAISHVSTVSSHW